MHVNTPQHTSCRLSSLWHSTSSSSRHWQGEVSGMGVTCHMCMHEPLTCHSSPKATTIQCMHICMGLHAIYIALVPSWPSACSCPC